MRTIIQNKLSSMLDELLERALNEKPNKINNYSTYYEIYYEYLSVTYNKKEDKYYIDYIIDGFDNNQLVTYNFLLTENQIELINKIYKKWVK